MMSLGCCETSKARCADAGVTKNAASYYSEGFETTKADAVAARFYRPDVSPTITELLKSENPG